MKAATPWYVIAYRPGPQWIDGRPVLEQELERHARYMQSLFDQEKLMFGGPLLDDTGGLAVIAAENAAEAAAIVRNDPAVAEGVFVGDAHSWQVFFNRYENRSLGDMLGGIDGSPSHSPKRTRR